MADFESRDAAWVAYMDHEELRQVVALLLDRMGLDVMRLTEIDHGEPKRESFYLIPRVALSVPAASSRDKGGKDEEKAQA